MGCRGTTTACIPAASPGTPHRYDPKAYIIPEDPLDTFDGPTNSLSPLPIDFPSWRKAMEKSLTLCHATETGLDAYIQTLSLDCHPDLTPRFKNQEIRRVDITIKTLNITRIRVEGIIKKMDRFLLDERNDPSTTQPQVSDYVMGWSEEFRDYVAKARAYLLDDILPTSDE